MGSVGYAYRMVRSAEPLLWSALPIGGRIGGFVCLSLGLGMVSQLPPRLQIPVERAVLSDAAVVDVTHANTTISHSTTNSGWKVRCPFDFTDNKSSTSVQGLDRITRHPGLWSLSFLGLGQACLTPSLPAKVWWSMPTLVALIGGAHTDSRYRRGMGGTLEEGYEKQTSNIPFWALMSGKQGDVGREMMEEVKMLNAAVAVSMAGLWVWRRGRGKFPVR
jgi:hypothetical protein